ncbi:MAG: sigma-70 family RNA polymerase sigma factor [candidate division Zixibacteria bacterium]|nr:sigma-70 family RNA polymerase sigma factor [candidate division Zixibacteria bacterium]
MRRTADHIRTELLVLRCQSGDETGFEELMSFWQQRIHRYVLRRVGGHDDAVDLEQEIWLSVARSIRRLDDPACFSQWIYRIATGRCVDWIRRQQRDRRIKGEIETQHEMESQTQVTEDDREATITRLRSAIAELPEDEQMILTMFYLDDVSTRDIAHALDIPIGTVKSRLYYARKHLRATIEGSSS